MYSTDNGPHMNSWPDAGMTPFRNEKNSNWEGAYRVPAMVRWPGRIPAGTTLNGIVSHNDWFITLLAAAGDAGHRRAPEGRHRAARHGFQSAPRREQPAGLHHGCRRTEPASPLLLRVGRRRPHGAAVRELEGGVPRAARRRHPARLAGALYRAALPEAVQPPHRPLPSGPTSRRTPTGTGCSTTSSCSCRRRRMSRGCCRVSWSSPRGRSRRRSRSTR